jgi:hypothetical protein
LRQIGENKTIVNQEKPKSIKKVAQSGRMVLGGQSSITVERTFARNVFSRTF